MEIEKVLTYLIGFDVAKTTVRGITKRQRIDTIDSEKKLLRSISDILVSMNVVDYDPLVLRQLSSFVCNHIHSIVLRAKRLNKHRTHSSSSSSSSSSTTTTSRTAPQLSLKDIQAAVRSWGQNRAVMQEESSIARKQAHKLNRKPLPKIKAVFGMQIPAPSRCFLNEEYTVTVVEEPSSSGVELISAAPQSSGQHRRRGRKRGRGNPTESSTSNNDPIDFNRIQPPSTKRSRTTGSGTINIKIN